MKTHRALLQHEAEATPATLETIYQALQRWERISLVKNAVIAGLVALVIVLGSGWWLVSHDHSIADRNTAVGNCRARELAITLGLFQTVVSPDVSDAAKQTAARTLGHLPTLPERYDACLKPSR